MAVLVKKRDGPPEGGASLLLAPEEKERKELQSTGKRNTATQGRSPVKKGYVWEVEGKRPDRHKEGVRCPAYGREIHERKIERVIRRRRGNRHSFLGKTGPFHLFL